MWSILLLLGALPAPALPSPTLAVNVAASQQARPAAGAQGEEPGARRRRAEAQRAAKPAPAAEAPAETSPEELELRMLAAVRRVVEEENHHDERLRELLDLRREAKRRGQDHRVESLEILLEREIVRHEEFFDRGREELGAAAFDEAVVQAHELIAAETTEVVDRLRDGVAATRDAAAKARALEAANAKLEARAAEAAAGRAAGAVRPQDAASMSPEERRKALREMWEKQGKRPGPGARGALGGKGGRRRKN